MAAMITRWRDIASVKQALKALSNRQAVLETAIRVQQIPAPTFHEQQRAAMVATEFACLGLHDIEIDDLGNVFARRPGVSGAPALLVTAHLDTVFPLTVDLGIRYEGDRVYGPGLGDNSLGVAALLHLARNYQQFDLPHYGDIWFVANVGEEGLGDLQGMRAVIDRLQSQLAAVVVIEGCDFGTLHHRAIGVRRYRIEAEAPGGHSWGDFGRPSAIHVLARLAAAITNLDVPRAPRTTYNIGIIEGGTSVNSIAQSASMLLDMRSAEPLALNHLASHVDALIDHIANQNPGVRLHSSVVGNRPAGAIPREHSLVQSAMAALRSTGANISFQQGSTDANIPLSRNIPAVCIGLTDGGNAHRLDEFIVPARLSQGMQALLLLTLATANRFEVIADEGC
jgi:tripeptide aminopeptidase